MKTDHVAPRSFESSWYRLSLAAAVLALTVLFAAPTPTAAQQLPERVGFFMTTTAVSLYAKFLEGDEDDNAIFVPAPFECHGMVDWNEVSWEVPDGQSFRSSSKRFECLSPGGYREVDLEMWGVGTFVNGVVELKYQFLFGFGVDKDTYFTCGRDEIPSDLFGSPFQAQRGTFMEVATAYCEGWRLSAEVALSEGFGPL